MATSETTKALFARRRAESICCFCGKNPSVKPHGTYCRSCLDKQKERRRNRVKEGGCYGCASRPALPGQTRCEKCRVSGNEAVYRRGRKVRDEVFDHYGRKCVCCGETGMKFLTIDHVNNDGAKHRDRGNGEGWGWRAYYWIKKNGFPDDLRTLCYNCNCGRARNGGICPHEVARGMP